MKHLAGTWVMNDLLDKCSGFSMETIQSEKKYEQLALNEQQHDDRKPKIF